MNHQKIMRKNSSKLFAGARGDLCPVVHASAFSGRRVPPWYPCVCVCPYYSESRLTTSSWLVATLTSRVFDTLREERCLLLAGHTRAIFAFTLRRLFLLPVLQLFSGRRVVSAKQKPFFCVVLVLVATYVLYGGLAPRFRRERVLCVTDWLPDLASHSKTRFVPFAFLSDACRSLLLLTLVTGADVNSSFTLGHSLSCFLVMVWSRKFAGTRVSAWRFLRVAGVYPFSPTCACLRCDDPGA